MFRLLSNKFFILTSFMLLCMQAAFANVPTRLTCIGDSWTAGVGVTTSCYPRIQMSSSPCSSGQNICDDLARDIPTVVAYQNLALGGATAFDALTTEAPHIDKNTTTLVLNIGYNDEIPLMLTLGSTNAINTSKYNPAGFLETSTSFKSYILSLATTAYLKAPAADIYVILPAKCDSLPVSGTCTGNPNFSSAYAEITTALNSIQQVKGVIDLGGNMSYSSSNFVMSGCPTAGIGDCSGHPNATGAAAIAAFIASGIASN